MSEIAVVEQREAFLPRITEKAIEELKTQYDMFRELQKRVLEPGIDYGWPAGRKSVDQKPSLYKSGAEKITRLFGLVPRFELIEKTEEDDFIKYMFKCTLYTPKGIVVGEGFGAANSREKNHWKKEPWANQNAILKIAKKRAHVDAVLTGLGASNVFTQDLEDMEDEIDSEISATEPQIKKLHVLFKEYGELTGRNPKEVKESVKMKYGVQHINELTKHQASEVIEMLQRYIEKHKE